MLLTKVPIVCLALNLVIPLLFDIQSSLFSPPAINMAMAAEHQKEQGQMIECSDRGNRLEGINCPKEVSGAYIELEAVLVVPQDRKPITEGESVHLRFWGSEGNNFVVEVREKRTNYFMKPKPSEIKDGIFSWPVNEVLSSLIKKVRLNYADLLPLAYQQDSTPQLAVVRPVALSHSRINPTVKGYHFIFRANADITISYKFYRKVEQSYSQLVKRGKILKPAQSSFLIDWDCKIGNLPAPDGDYVLILEGVADVGPSHEQVKAVSYFYHKNSFGP